jgi:phosphatidylserine decarboxylase
LRCGARHDNVRAVSAVRRLLLTALPKVALSRAAGIACAIPLPERLRPWVYGWFARRYGADVAEMQGRFADYPSLARFFQRSLRPEARPIATAPLIWPCDGRIVTSGPLDGQRIPQVKGNDYALADLLGDADLAARLAGGSQATIYLAPGDYHRVHAPFTAVVAEVRAIRGTLFPVNPTAVRCIANLFARNARHVFRCELPGGRPAAVAMVGAYNVGGTHVTAVPGATVERGAELGRFGFGSTTIVVLGPGTPALEELPPETRVAMGAAVPTSGS